MIDFRPLGALDLDVGESPVWDDRRQAIFLCDIPKGAIVQIGLDGTLQGFWRFEGPVGSLGLAESGCLVLALGRDVILFDPENQARSLVAHVPEPDTNRLNDGKVGPDGWFYVGGMDDRPTKKPVAGLYRVSPAGVVEQLAEGLTISNGLAWSPDGRTFYHSDSRGPWIDAQDADPDTGALSHRRRFAQIEDAWGRPDGGACDADGYYWSAGVSAGRLNRFAPDGRLVSHISLPVRAPTMPCFAGPQRDLLVVTSLRSEGQSGGVLVGQAPVAGVPIARFRDATP